MVQKWLTVVCMYRNMCAWIRFVRSAKRRNRWPRSIQIAAGRTERAFTAEPASSLGIPRKKVRAVMKPARYKSDPYGLFAAPWRRLVGNGVRVVAKKRMWRCLVDLGGGEMVLMRP